MYLREISLTAERPVSEEQIKVENMSRVVCALLAKSMRRKVKTRGFWKIMLEFNQSSPNEKTYIVSGVLSIPTVFSADRFLALPLKERQSQMLRLVCDGLKRLDADKLESLDRNSWHEIVDEATQYVLESQFRNTIRGRKRFKNEDGSKAAFIECEQDMDRARFYLVIKEKRRVSRRILVGEEVPEEFIFQCFFGTIEWLEEKVILEKTDGKRLEIPLALH